MKIHAPRYVILQHPKQGLWLRYDRAPLRLLTWAIPSAIKRMIISIALGPNEVRLQKPVHVVFLSDDRTEKGHVIVNVLPCKSNKPKKSYFSKMSASISKNKRQYLSFNNPQHRTYIDSIINEIRLLLDGKSEQKKCKNKSFLREEIHLKGIERLDVQLKTYFKEQVKQKCGIDISKQTHAINLDFYTLETPDQAILESVQVSTPKELEKPMCERKFVLTCMARNQNYIYWLKDFYSSAKSIGCTVVGFNYRGIDYSKGMALTYHYMVNDTLAQAQHLLELGVKPQNIAIEGMSLGGAIATISAAKLHDKGFKVSLYNERSYRSLIRLIIGYVMPASNSNVWKPINWLKYITAAFSYIIIAPFIRLLGWHIDAASAWDRIPYQYKNYAVVRNHNTPGKFDDDDLVHDSFSSIASLIDEAQALAQHKKKHNQALSTEEKLLLADESASHEFTLDRSNPNNKNPSNHSAPRRFLLDTKTGSTTIHAHMVKHLRSKPGKMPQGLDAQILDALQIATIPCSMAS